MNEVISWCNLIAGRDNKKFQPHFNLMCIRLAPFIVSIYSPYMLLMDIWKNIKTLMWVLVRNLKHQKIYLTLLIKS